MTSIGGLLSLWLGISALDLRVVVEISIEMLKNITVKVVWIYIENYTLFECFQKIVFEENYDNIESYLFYLSIN
jgi:hypothetical protein